MNPETGQLTIAPTDADTDRLVDPAAIPATPPPEVLDELDAAWERAVELAAQNLELHFARDEASGRPIVELRTLSGELVRTITAAQALQIIAGRQPGEITAT
jgi:hypothetical protein